jgi:hypothetical protein
VGWVGWVGWVGRWVKCLPSWLLVGKYKIDAKVFLHASLTLFVNAM